MSLKGKNWIFCPNCDCISYITGCECHSSTCNGLGCDKCREIIIEAERAILEGTTPFHNKRKVEKARKKAKDKNDKFWRSFGA